VLLEGGPTLAAAFLRARLVDEMVIHLAPKLLGAGPSLVDDLGIHGIGGALDLTVVDVTRLGGDVGVRLRPTRHTGDRQSADGRS
jgi:diaminohydroxyphosphoribosylaminopyrimidine deaminase / 5-amino-6-(5-phosphoribosylamino)uracil reductase